MSLTLIIILVVFVLLLSGGGWYGHRTWGPRGGMGVVGVLLLVLLFLYLVGAIRV